MTALAAVPPTPLAESLPRLERLVSPFTGVVRAVHEVLAPPHDARLVRLATAPPDMRPLLGFHPDHLDDTSGGSAETRAQARAAAIGELVERYAASFVPEETLVHGPAARFREEAVSPERFSLFAPEQYRAAGFPFVPFTAATPVRWTRGFRLPGGEPALLPAQLVYLRWDGFGAGEAPIGVASSSGLACGPTLEESVLAGLLELVERDAFVLTWTHRLSLPLLDHRDTPGLPAWEERYLAPAGARHHVVDLSAFLGVPVALAVVRSEGAGEPAVAVGAGSAATACDAGKKALAEGYAVRTWARALLAHEPARRFSATGDEVVTFSDHVHFHARPEHAETTAFLTSSSERRALADVPALPGDGVLEWIRAICTRLASQGCTAFAVDVTTPDVRDAGLYVTKTIVPQLCPLDVRQDARLLGGERLRTLPHRLGLATGPLRWEDVNPYPHPFP